MRQTFEASVVKGRAEIDGYAGLARPLGYCSLCFINQEYTTTTTITTANVRLAVFCRFPSGLVVIVVVVGVVLVVKHSGSAVSH